MKWNERTIRPRWAAIGAAVAVTIGGGGLMSASATISSGERAVFVPIVPCRIMDTRPATNVGPRSTPIGPAQTHTIPVLGVNGQCTIPADATGLVMNVTGINPTAATYLTVFPFGSPTPNASNLNLVAGQPPVPNAVTVDVPATGKISFYNNGGNLDVAADIVGYYVDSNFDDRYYTKAQDDARSMFAVVNANGTLRRGSTGVTSSLFAGGFAGDFTVTFPRDVSTCGFVASTTATTEGNNPVHGVVGVTLSSATAIYVQTNTPADADVALPFTVMATCP